MRFEPGKSGNPGGRPKEDAETAEAKRIARSHGPKALAKLAELVDHSNPQVARSAAEAILDRAYGKPTQTVESEVHQVNYDALVQEMISGRRPEG